MASPTEKAAGPVPGAGGGVHELAAGRYRVLRQLARGSMTDVYEVEHIDIGKRCVAKVARHPFSVDPRLTKALVNEGRALSALKHPNLVEVLGYGTDPKHGPFLILELLEGETLAALLKREKTLAIPRAVNLMEGMVSALVAVHTAGLVHRNISPEGLFVTKDRAGQEQLKLLDFGFSRSADGAKVLSTEVAPFAVAVPYFPLEQLKDGAGVDAKADVYAAAAVVFTMLTGTPPHDQMKPLDRIDKGEGLAPPSARALRPEVPEWLDALLTRALATKIADRVPSAATLLSSLKEAQRGAGGFDDDEQTWVQESPVAFKDGPTDQEITNLHGRKAIGKVAPQKRLVTPARVASPPVTSAPNAPTMISQAPVAPVSAVAATAVAPAQRAGVIASAPEPAKREPDSDEMTGLATALPPKQDRGSDEILTGEAQPLSQADSGALTRTGDELPARTAAPIPPGATGLPPRGPRTFTTAPSQSGVTGASDRISALRSLDDPREGALPKKKKGSIWPKLLALVCLFLAGGLTAFLVTSRQRKVADPGASAATSPSPASSASAPADKKPEDKKGDEKKAGEVAKPDDDKPDEKAAKPDEKKADEVAKPDEKKPDEKKPDEKAAKPDEKAAKPDEKKPDERVVGKPEDKPAARIDPGSLDPLPKKRSHSSSSGGSPSTSGSSSGSAGTTRTRPAKEEPKPKAGGELFGGDDL